MNTPQVLAPGRFIESDSIYLRGVIRSDLSTYAAWLEEERVTEFLEMGARPSREGDCEAFWSKAQASDESVVFMICENSTNRVVGTCGLYLIQWVCRRAQFNILIGDPEVWGKGYGRQATTALLDYGFSKLNLESIQLGVNAENLRAVRAYEKAGFVHEGCRRRFIYRNGRYYDVLLMSVLRDEYPAGE